MCSTSPGARTLSPQRRRSRCSWCDLLGSMHGRHLGGGHDGLLNLGDVHYRLRVSLIVFLVPPSWWWCSCGCSIDISTSPSLWLTSWWNNSFQWTPGLNLLKSSFYVEFPTSGLPLFNPDRDNSECFIIRSPRPTSFKFQMMFAAYIFIIIYCNRQWPSSSLSPAVHKNHH